MSKHRNIMNIPCEVPDVAGISAEMAYKIGHRDARHAAAEIAGYAPKVKPLVWEGDGHWHSGDNEGWMEEADTPFGWGYSIEFDINGAFMANSTFGWTQDGFDYPDEAKAAAQAEYERRILEALE